MRAGIPVTMFDGTRKGVRASPNQATQSSMN